MSVPTKHELAQRLRDAYLQGAVEPLRDGLAADDADGAYEVQQINTRYWLDQGRRIVGFKIGLTSAAVQAQFGVSQPDYGVLFGDRALANGDPLAIKPLLQPHGEAEIALVLAQDLDQHDVSADDIAAATAYATPALEIVDSRIANWRITFADTVADNGSSSHFVLGDARKPLEGLDLYSCGMVLEVNGSVKSIGAGAASLGHPFNAAAWLAQTMARNGTPLTAGQVLLTGALGPMVPLSAGQHVRATIGGLGDVSVRCESGP